MRVGYNPKKRGELAELAFVYRATSLGFGVARTYGDSDCYDFIVLSGRRFWRVQVKSSSAIHDGAYIVNAQRSACGQRMPYTAEEIDFLVAYIVPEDAWFVIPVEAFAVRNSIKVYPRGEMKIGPYEKYRDAWSLMG